MFPLTRRVNRIIIISLMLGLGILSAYFARALFITLEETTSENLTQQGNFIYRAIENFMLPGEAPLAVDFFQSIQNLDPDYTIHLYRTDGTAAFSDGTTIREVNLRLGKEAFSPPSTMMPAAEAPRSDRFYDVLGPPPTTVSFQQNDTSRVYQKSYKPLLNLPNCTGCHGDNHTVRGILDLQVDITDIRNRQYFNVALSGGLFLGLLIILILVIGRSLHHQVLEPVRQIGQVCHQVTQGDFSPRVDITNRDEIGDLGDRINSMVQGLRERFQLTKYVSASTLQALQGTEEGKKAEVTLFFSDIRGFTAFSDTREPQEIVEVLNGILTFQTEIITRFEGDIDKYVGDEIVAVFSGDRHVLRAARAALGIQKHLQQNQGYQGLHVGIGINTGEVIMGQMGSDLRADYTVIGDSVNTASRLCNAARADEVLLAPSTVKAIESRGIFRGPRELSLKGKSQSIEAYTLTGLKSGKKKKTSGAANLLLITALGILLTGAGCEGRTENLVNEPLYRQWERTHTEELNYPIPGHENNYRIIYINPVGETPQIEGQTTSRRYNYPEGTVVIKEVYQGTETPEQKEPMMLTLMVKKPNHPQAHDGWVYLMKSPETGEETIIQDDLCFTCHRAANDNHPYGDKNPNSEFRDYLFFPSIAE